MRDKVTKNYNTNQKYSLTEVKSEKYIVDNRVVRWFSEAVLTAFGIYLVIVCCVRDVSQERMLIAIFAMFPLVIIIRIFSRVVKSGIYSWFRAWELAIKTFFALSVMILLLGIGLQDLPASIIKSSRLASVFATLSVFTVFLRYLLKGDAAAHCYEIRFIGDLVELVKDFRSIGLKLARKEGDIIYFHIDKWAILNREYIVFERKDHFILSVDKILKDELIAISSQQDRSIKSMA